MRRSILTSAIAAIAVLAAAPMSAQNPITPGIVTGGVTPLGKDDAFPGIPTAVAQTFVLPGGTNFLQTFRFFISQGFEGDGTNLQLRASVYEFDAFNGNLGALFYESGIVKGSGNTGGFDEIAFGAPDLNLHLTPGTTYALLLSSVEEYGSTVSPATITVATSDDVYSGGTLFITTDTDMPSLSLPNAFFDAGGFDATFGATFSTNATPEPSTIVFMATGFFGVAAVARRRRRAVV